ncbi:hypothetical protein ACFL2Y_00005, partial [Candidatus Omnitrophota bacterium]
SLWSEIRLFGDRDAPGWISKMDSINIESLSDKFKKEADLLIFDNDLVLDLSRSSAYILRGRGVDVGIPYSVAYIEDGVLKEDVLEDSNLDYSVLIFKTDQGTNKSIFLDKDLTKSMFVRMYFLKGEELKFFDKLLEEETPDGNFIYTYKLNWPE